MERFGLVLPGLIGLAMMVVVLGLFWMFIAVGIQIGGQAIFKRQVPRRVSGWSAGAIVGVLMLIGIVRALVS
jgi:hypothetical protein